jgi:hypothetical protein
MITPECEAGCLALSGGDVRHQAACPHYPESIAAMYDREKARSSRLIKGLFEIAEEHSGFGTREAMAKRLKKEYEASDD